MATSRRVAALARARAIVRAVVRGRHMIFEEGWFHADPHPGNIMALDDGQAAAAGAARRSPRPLLMNRGWEGGVPSSRTAASPPLPFSDAQGSSTSASA